MQAVLEAHDAKADRTVLEIGVARLVDVVEVEVDHVVQHAHAGADRPLQLLHVEQAGGQIQVRRHVDRRQVAHGDFIRTGIQRDLCAQVRAVHDADVLLRRTQVAGILEGDPGMPGLKQHGQHLPPQLQGRNPLEQFHFAVGAHRLVFDIGLLESLAEFLVQVGHVRRREQRPLAGFHHALHEQIRNPVRRVHVVGAAAVVASVLAQLEEFLNVQMPGLQVRAHRTLALAALIHCHSGVVDHFQERHHALRFAVGALDIGAERAHGGPVVADAAGILLQHRVFLDGFVDAVEVIGHCGQVAAGELRAARAGVEQCRGRAHQIKTRQHVVELDRTRFALAFRLVQCEAHRHAHEKHLRQFDALAFDVQEITVVQDLQTEIGELEVTLCIQRGAKRLHVVMAETLVEEFGLDALLDELRQVGGVTSCHFFLRHFLPKCFEAHRVH